jgi:hypothetical protein
MARLFVALGLLVVCAAVQAGSLRVELTPADSNPARPRMGDRMMFRTVIRNAGVSAVHGVLAWISLVRVDRGHEQPMDLEDWSARKAVTAARLEPGWSLVNEWPMRLIQAGTYRVVVSVVSRDSPRLAASRFAQFAVHAKPVVESRRILPVAGGIPLLLAALLVMRTRKVSP